MPSVIPLVFFSFLFAGTAAVLLVPTGAVVKSRGVVAFSDYDLTEFLTGRLTFSYYRNSESSGADADVYRVGVGLSYRLLEWLSFRASYDFSYEDGTLAAVVGSTASRDNHVRHSVVIVGFEASKTYRID